MKDKELPESRRARLDAEFEDWIEKSSLIGPAQHVVVNVYDVIDGTREQRKAAIESLASALRHGERDNVEAWVRQHLSRHAIRMGDWRDIFVSQVVVEMFEHYAKVEYREDMGVHVTAGGNENLAALLDRAKTE